MQIFERENADKLDFSFFAPMISAKGYIRFSDSLGGNEEESKDRCAERTKTVRVAR